jgi:hypothetical protein
MAEAMDCPCFGAVPPWDGQWEDPECSHSPELLWRPHKRKSSGHL